jgi:hypothetical protein
MCVLCVILSVYLCGEEKEERGQGGPSGLVPIWHGVDPAARNNNRAKRLGVFSLRPRLWGIMDACMLTQTCALKLLGGLYA